MKQIARNILYLSLMFLTSCELSMLEYELTEDQKGKDEPYTLVNEYGEFTYQYNKNVTSLNGEPQDYIATMNDSVIYFMDNLPEKWMPKEGEYIAANCSKTIPLGLCARVRHVTREAGMIRVEHEPATKAEVFKKYKLKLDIDYTMPGMTIVDDGTTEESRSSKPDIKREGYWINDSVFIDMSLYEPNSRGDVDQDESTDFHVSKSFGPAYVDFLCSSVDHVKVHKYEDPDKDYAEEWTDSYTERDYTLLIGIGKSVSEVQKSLGDNPKDMSHMKEMLNSLSENKDLKNYKQFVKGICPAVSIPGFPIAFLFELTFETGFDLMCYGTFQSKSVSKTKRVGYITQDGDEIKIDEYINNPLAKPGYSTTNVQFGGSFDVWGRARVGIGCLAGSAAGGLGVVVGYEVKIGVKGSVETESFSDCEFVDKQNSNLEVYWANGGYGKGVLKFLWWTVSLGDMNFGVDSESLWKMNLKAVVDNDRTSAELKEYEYETPVVDENGNPKKNPETGQPITESRMELQLNANVCFKELEKFFMFPYCEKLHQRAAMRIYEVHSDDKVEDKFKQIVFNDVLTAGTDYSISNKSIEKMGLDPKVGVYKVVPCIYDTKYKNITEYQENAKVVTLNEPYISRPYCYQFYGKELSDDAWEYYKIVYEDLYGKDIFKDKKREDFVEYQVSSVMNIYNSVTVKELGLFISLHLGDKKLIEKEVPLKINGVCPTGRFTVFTQFISEYKSGKSNDDQLFFVVIPYYIKKSDHKQNVRSSGGTILKYPYESEIVSMGSQYDADF